MKKIALAIFAALALVAIAPAQGKLDHMRPMRTHSEMSVKDCCLQGLSPKERKIGMDMMQHGTPAEGAAMMKRCNMCMHDPHTALQKMKPSQVTEKMKMDHMMSGMSKDEQKTMMAMMHKMTPAQRAVCEKMCMNCCTYGMQHAGHHGK